MDVIDIIEKTTCMDVRWDLYKVKKDQRIYFPSRVLFYVSASCDRVDYSCRVKQANIVLVNTVILIGRFE